MDKGKNMRIDKETKRLLKESQEKIIREQKMKKRFLGTELDYRFIEYMLEKIDVDPNLVCDITLNNGHRIVIARKKQQSESTENLFNGEIAVGDIRE